MKWKEITQYHPNRLVLVEALQASSKNRVRTIEEMAVIQEYEDPKEAWEGYKLFHKKDPQRELYIFHTSRENVEVIEEFFSAVRQH